MEIYGNKLDYNISKKLRMIDIMGISWDMQPTIYVMYILNVLKHG